MVFWDVIDLFFVSSLANHGFLPHDGQNISVPMIMDAALGALQPIHLKKF
jgi:hypothetical protein